MKQFPIQQLKILYNKYGTRNNKVKSLMRTTQDLVPCLLLCSAAVSIYGLSLMVMATVTLRAAGIDPFGSRPSTGTIAVRMSPTLRTVTADVPSESRGIVFDLRTMVRLSRVACSTVCGVEASIM